MILSICPNPSIDSYAWIDAFHVSGVNRISKLRDYPGGKGVHVALAVKELGENSQIFGIWTKNNGSWIEEKCIEKGLETSGILIEGNNRKCYTFRSASEKLNNTEILEPGPELKTKDWHLFKEEYILALREAEIVCMSGSWPKEAPIDAYVQLIKIAKKENKKCIIDISGVQLEKVLQEGCFGIHLNEDEAMDFCGSAEISNLLNKINNVDLIALTRGKDGLTLYYKGKVVKANTLLNEVISTVGSGDCLTAGIAYAVTKQMKIEEIASWGVACGAANCINEDLGMIKRDDVLELLGKISIKKVV